MIEKIQRKIWLTENRGYEPLPVTENSKLPIELEVMDVTLSGETALVYAWNAKDGEYVQNGTDGSATVSGQIVTIVPSAGLFLAGRGKLQVHFPTSSGEIITRTVPIDCQPDFSSGGETPKAEAVKPLIERAEQAAALADEVAKSIPADYTNLSNDVNRLKEDLVQLQEEMYNGGQVVVKPSMFEPGNYNEHGEKVTAGRIIRLIAPITVKKGNTLYTKASNMYVGWNLIDSSGAIVETGFDRYGYWVKMIDKDYEFQHDGTVYLTVRNGPNYGNSSDILPSDFNASIVFHKSVTEKKITDLENLVNGNKEATDAAMRTINDKVSSYDGIVLYGDNPSVFLLGEFASAGLTTSGELYTSQKYRCSSVNYIIARVPLVCHIASGFRFGWYGESGWSGWYISDITIPAGTRFKFQIARVSEIASEIADIHEFTAAITFDVPSNSLQAKVDDVASKLNYISEYLTDLSAFEAGGIGNNGIKTGDGSRVRTVDFIPFDKLGGTIINNIESLKFGIHYYTASQGWIKSTTWITDAEYVSEKVPNCEYVKFVMAYRNDTSISSVSVVDNAIEFRTKIIDAIRNAINSQSESRTQYEYYGEAIPSMARKFDARKIMRFYYGGITAQDIEAFDDYLFIAFSDTEQIKIHSLVDGSLVSSIEIPVHHGSSMQFSGEKYSSDDAFPLLYVGGDTDNLISVIRFTGGNGTFSASVIRTIYLPLEHGVYLSPSVDKQNNVLYAYGHETAMKTGAMKLSKWDLNNLTNNGDGTFTPLFISECDSPNTGTFQGHKFYNGRMYVGITNDGRPYKPRFIAIDVSNGNIVSTVDVSGVFESELEGLCYRIKDDNITWIINEYYDVFELKF